jgi:betaine-aldehyde dehydrogenase
MTAPNTSPTGLGITQADRPMVIGGADVEAASGERFERLSPAHDVLVGTYPKAGEEDVDRAVLAARRAFDLGPWPHLAGKERARLLSSAAELVRREAGELARTEVLESGKPISQARDEVEAAAELWDYAATLARHAYGDAHNALGEDVLAVVLREAVGVVAVITPWNFPLLIVSQKLPFALAAGCTAVVKPSDFTPGSTVRLAQLLRSAGFPDGVVNVVTGAGEVGAAMVAHPGVDMVSFTGSTAVGRQIGRAAGERLRKAELELGGKNPQIVCDDADFEAALDAVVFGVYFNSGQCCNSGSRVLAQRGIAEQLTQAVVERSRVVPVGDPLDPATKVGAITHEKQLHTIERYVAEGRSAGARLLLGGARLPTNVGRFYEPTVFANVTPTMSIAREEIFGPVLSVLTFSGIDEAIELANETMYGLSAGIWTRDLSTAIRAARGIRAGTIWVNRWMEGYPELPFGGFANSGLGRELGRQALDEFTETKTVQFQVGPRTSWWSAQNAEGPQ